MLYSEQDPEAVQLLPELQYRQSDLVYTWARDICTVAERMVTDCPDTTVQDRAARLAGELQAIAARIRDMAKRSEV